MSESDKRWIYKDNDSQGPFTVDELYRMAKRGELDHTSIFWSDAEQQWLPLTKLIFDIQPSDLQDKIRAGIRFTEILDSGTGEDCPQCISLTGQKYQISNTPQLPPDGCTCIPWCRCVVVAAE